MPLTTPFHSRLEEINQTKIWKNWSGYLTAPQYQYSLSSEYYSVRNAVSLLDTSPLFKYRFVGRDARTLLELILLRDVCLLYTSPSPRDLSTSRMPSSA